jgi:hypothetical protein
MTDLLDVIGFTDSIIWVIPGTVSDYLGRRRDFATNNFSRSVYGAVKGVIDGTIKLHHLPAVVDLEFPISDSDKERMDRFRANENRAERYARRLTMLAETVGYGYLASQLNPWSLTPVIYNVADMFMESRLEDEACGYDKLPGTPRDKDPKWIENGFSLLNI